MLVSACLSSHASQMKFLCAFMTFILYYLPFFHLLSFYLALKMAQCWSISSITHYLIGILFCGFFIGIKNIYLRGTWDRQTELILCGVLSKTCENVRLGLKSYRQEFEYLETSSRVFVLDCKDSTTWTITSCLPG